MYIIQLKYIFFITIHGEFVPEIFHRRCEASPLAQEEATLLEELGAQVAGARGNEAPLGCRGIGGILGFFRVGSWRLVVGSMVVSGG